MKLFTIVVYAVTCQIGFSEDLNKNSAKLIQSFGIEKNFKGFSYESDAPNEFLNVRLLPGALEGKTLSGVTLIISDNGKLSEIKPLFLDFKKSFESTSWALDMFKQGKITIDALWEIFRASIPKDANDTQVMSFLISTLESSEGYPPLSEVLILSNGSLSKAVVNTAEGKLDKMPKSLGEIKHFLKGIE